MLMKVELKQRDEWSGLADIISDIILKHADEIDFDSLPAPDEYLKQVEERERYLISQGKYSLVHIKDSTGYECDLPVFSREDEEWIREYNLKDKRGNKKMSRIELINASCADQEVDVVVNAANDGLWAGGGICGVIFKKAGMAELTAACKKHKTPLNDGDAVITPAFNMTNAKAIIHAVGPDFGVTPKAFKELFDAYYNSIKVMMDNGYHSISFPLISSGIFGGSLVNPVGESTKQCCRAYKKFIEDYPDYDIDVKVCVYSAHEVSNAQAEFNQYFK